MIEITAIETDNQLEFGKGQNGVAAGLDRVIISREKKGVYRETILFPRFCNSIPPLEILVTSLTTEAKSGN